MRPLLLLFVIVPVLALASGVDVKQQRITVSILTEPPSLDSAIAEDSGSRDILREINEGLVRSDRRLNVIPGVAERWIEQNETVTFHLRADAKWADGSPVTAHDFVYAWRRLVDPKTGASGSLSIAYIIENATEIIAGELPTEKLGVVAKDDKTLVVTKSGPVPFFLAYIGSAPFYPLKQSFVEAQGERFAAEPEHLLSNGPFVLTKWVHGAALEFQKNPLYWNAAETNLSGYDIGYVTSDNRTLMNLFISGDLATFVLNAETLEDASERGIKLRQNPTTGCIGLVTFNFREGRSTANKNLRKAIQAIIDPEIYTNKIIAVPANTPAKSIFPSWLGLADSRLWATHPPPSLVINQELGRRYLKAAVDEVGQVPNITLLAWEGQERQVEYLQGTLKTQLGLDVKIDKQSYKQAVSKLIAGDFDMSLSRFCSAIQDPDFFASIFHSADTFNDGRFANEEYDRLFMLTRQTSDVETRLDAFGQMQKVLFEEAVVLPTHEVGYVYAQDDRVLRIERFPGLSYARTAVRQ